IHLGLHLNRMIYKIKNKIKKSMFEYVIYMLLIFVLIFGIYSFINNQLIDSMFLITEYKHFDYSKNFIIFYLEYLSISILISFITYFIIKLKRKNKNK